MGNLDEKLPGFVNSSGFPLQLGIERLVEATRERHGWRALSREHPWRNEASGTGGFIDLILENHHRVQVMVTECKRVRDTVWIFLVPSKEEKLRRHVKARLPSHDRLRDQEHQQQNGN